MNYMIYVYRYCAHAMRSCGQTRLFQGACCAFSGTSMKCERNDGEIGPARFGWPTPSIYLNLANVHRLVIFKWRCHRKDLKLSQNWVTAFVLSFLITLRHSVVWQQVSVLRCPQDSSRLQVTQLKCQGEYLPSSATARSERTGGCHLSETSRDQDDSYNISNHIWT